MAPFFSIADYEREKLALLIELLEEHAVRSQTDPMVCSKHYVAKVVREVAMFFPNGLEQLLRGTNRMVYESLHGSEWFQATAMRLGYYHSFYRALARLLQDVPDDQITERSI